MISKAMVDIINKQINNEMYSAYLYMAMSADASSKGLNGFAKWFMVQYHEEMLHALKFYNYLLDQGAEVHLQTIKEPPKTFASARDMFEKTLEHERFVTKSINEIADLAQKEQDHATYTFIQWYVTEQIEEEKNDTEILQRLKLAGDTGPGLFMLDAALGARTVTVQTDFSAGVPITAGA
ncbi:ferritin [Gracilinema caldarium]|uniref:ferritin n=1 Tax=Gracilinema caldarium TaxID=215591 RepID=UPI0026E9320F|nr:ferritin [Gracilinema caldarium]